MVKKKVEKVFVRSSVKLKPAIHKKLRKYCLEIGVGIQEFMGSIMEQVILAHEEESKCGSREKSA